MNLFNVLLQTTIVQLLAPASRDGDATPGAAIDLRDYEGTGRAVLHAALGTGTLPTLDVALEESDDDQAAGEVEDETIDAVEQGETYSLDYHHVSSVVITDDEVEPTTFDVGDDYTVDAVKGTITIVVDGGIADETNLLVSYDYSTRFAAISAAEFDQVTGAAGSGIQTLDINVTNRKRYLRATPTIDGTTPAFVCSAEFIAVKKASE